MSYFGQDLFEQAAAKGPLNDPLYIETRSNIRKLAGEQGIDAALRRNSWTRLSHRRQRRHGRPT